MRILHFGPEGGEENFFSLLAGFRNIGCEVRTCNVVKCEETERVSEKAIEEFKPDFVITIGGWHAHFDTQVLWKVIKKHSLPHIYWAIEDPTFFDWVSSVHVKNYDFVFTVSEECLSRYKEFGVPAAYLPYACNPSFHRRVPVDEKFKNDIVVMANKVKEYDPERCKFRNKSFKDIVEPIVLGNFDVKLYGSGWSTHEPEIPSWKLGGYINSQNVLKAYSGAKINLAIQWDYTGHICFRVFEALACGCFVISPYTPVQAKTFIHGQHIIYSSGPEQTRDYVEYYLSHDAERQEIAVRGQEEVYKNHNCTLRAYDALNILKEYKIV